MIRKFMRCVTTALCLAVKARARGRAVLRRSVLWTGVRLCNGWRLDTPCGPRRRVSATGAGVGFNIG